MTTPKSFGLIQEETIKKSDFIRDELNYITPLYLERMHVILRIDKNNPYANLFSTKSPPVLTSNTDRKILKLFANAKISTGPVGSGSIVIASYILGELNNQIKSNNIEDQQQVLNLSMARGLERIKKEYQGEDKIDILFSIAGTPIKDLKKLLEDEDYILIGIDPSFVSRINLENNLNLRLTDFKHNHEGRSTGIYQNSVNTSTLGSYAWLISSKDIPSKDILGLLDAIKRNDNNIAKNLGVVNVSIDHSPLKEMGFYELYKSRYKRESIGEWKSILIFLTSFSLAIVSVFSFQLYILSFIKQSKYFHDIVDIIERSSPANTELQEYNHIVGEVPSQKDLPYLRPKVFEKQEDIINKVISGIQEILIITKNINQDFQSGTLTNSSYTFLSNKVEDTRQKLQKHLGQRLNEVIERKDGLKDIKIMDDIRIYYTAGYLLDEDYLNLKIIINPLHQTNINH